METRLVNVTGEKDYLLGLFDKQAEDGRLFTWCEYCKSRSESDNCWITCDTESIELGIPEDWRADDGT